ncbi:MAG TPA: hypothetical protein VF510_01625 [Ktedonobacterales bacterium]
MNQLSLLLHIRKTALLINAVLHDARVHWLPKSLFLGTLSALVIALLGGDVVSEVVSNILPVVGPVLGLPADAGLDWVFFSVAAFNLLKLFPADIVGEHYDRLFRSGAQGRSAA